jgi:arylsulfatase
MTRPGQSALWLAAVLAALAGCSPFETQADPPNVVLITIDALRADAVSWAGYAHRTTPNLDRLAEDSAVFTLAFTSFPGTTASMPSLMTGLFPNFEEVERWDRFSYHGFNEYEEASANNPPGLSNRLTMLAEVLSERGYRTAGFNTNPNLGVASNFNQGFDVYEQFGPYLKSARENRSHRLRAAYPPADVVMKKVLPAIDDLQGSPFFLWIHLMEPHSPYLPPPTFARRSPRVFTDRSDLEINEVVYRRLYAQRGKMGMASQFASRLDLGLTQAAYLEHLLGLYEGEILFCDDTLGRMIGRMDVLGLMDETLFIVTADHGEEFYDHGFVMHHFESALAEELIRVPLLIRPPGGIGKGPRVDRLVRMVDLAPTILDYLDLEETGAGMEGVSLRPLIDGGRIEELAAFFSTIEFGIVRTERWKYRLEKHPEKSDQPVERLFDIVNDPMESVDVAADHPDVLSELRSAWSDFSENLRNRRPQDVETPGPDRQDGDLDEATREQLEALGYLDD